MWRFALMSILVHALFATLWLGHAPSTILLPAPALAVSLNEIAVQSTPPAPASFSVPRASTALPESGLNSAVTDATNSPAQDNNVVEQGDQQRRNQLQSLLRAAFEAQFVYPPLARRQGWQGRVQVALRVEADGRFSELRVLRSSGYASLDHDALQTLQRIGQLAQARLWLDGRAMRVELPVVYRLLES